MTAWTDPVELLATDCAAALLVVSGAAAEHAVGKKFDFSNARPPRYVWVPTRAKRETEQVQTRSVSEFRTLCALERSFAVGCWGRTLRECWAMANNLYRALFEELKADLTLDGLEWERPSEAWNQKGELLVMQFSMSGVFIDAYVALDPAAEEPERATVMPTVIEANVQQTDDPAQVGEVGVDLVTTAP